MSDRIHLSKRAFEKRFMKTALAVCIASAGQVWADDASEGDDFDLEEIVVTGSHIRKDSFNSSSPMSVVNAEAIEGVGAVNVGDLLSRIPSITGDVTGTSVNVNVPQSSGISTTALRNLGTSRTLVLVNGRRYVSGMSAGAGYGVDLNTIPTTMIERVDVLTGGQSAAYGSDAVAGVINIITKTDFEGVELNTQFSESSESDREKQDISLTLGKNFDGGNVWFSFGHSNDEGLQSSDRDFSRYSQKAIDTDGDGLGDTLMFEGSSYIPGTRLIGGGMSIKGDGSAFDGGRDLATTDRLNFNEYRSLAIPLTRNFAAAGLKLDISEKATATIEMNYARVESRASFEPIPLSIVNDVYKVNRGGASNMALATHPLWAGSTAGALLQGGGVTSLDELSTFRRTVELGGRGSGNTRTTFRFAGSFDYELTNDLFFSLYGTYGVTEQNQTDFGDINLERARLALDMVADGSGGYMCADAAARISGCVPFNPFNTLDSVAGQAGIVDISPDAVNYLYAETGLKGEVEQLVLSGVLSGDLPFQLGNNTISFAAGVEYREEQGSETPDGLRQKGITRGYNIEPTSGEFDVVDFFGELYVPISEKLNMDIAFRSGDYSTVGRTTTWKVGLDAPISESLRIRAAQSTSVRAPNISDLFAGRVANASIVVDPCNGVDATASGNVADNCRSIQQIQDRINTDGSFALTQVESQNVTSYNTGSPNVLEETAESSTLGIVFTPMAVENLSVALDYYDIKIEDAIRVPNGSVILDRCYSAAPGSFDDSCGGLVFRDPNTGPVLDVQAVANNEDTIETSGIDLEVSYFLGSVGPGNMNVAFSANFLNKYDVIGLDGDVQELKGEVLFPKMRFTTSLSYDLNDFNIFAQLRYWDETNDRNDGVQLNDNLNVIDSSFLVDLRGSYKLSDIINVYVGANNLFDEQPVSMGFNHKYSEQGTNTNGSVFDVTGRQIYAGLKVKF